jgi:S1-C subfamily serine protease
MKTLLTFLVLLISGELYSQKISNEAMIFNDLPEKIKDLKRTSLSIESSDMNFKKFNTIGSGFLVIKNDIHYAISNFHVTKNLTKNQILLIGMNLDQKKQYAVIDTTYTDEKHDIIVMKLGSTFSLKNNIKVDSTLFEPSAVGISMFETNDNIVEGTGIILIGYPLGLGTDLVGNQPISRIGIIAQKPNENTNTFFIDGIASHGNSGSPVFNAQNKKLVGMISSYPSDFITAFDENGQLVARLPYNSGLSLCITAEMINKIIP